MTRPVGAARAPGITTLTLDSPANRNALSADLVGELRAALAAAAADAETRAIVLTHAGTTFCAGADLKSPATLPTSWPCSARSPNSPSRSWPASPATSGRAASASSASATSPPPGRPPRTPSPRPTWAWSPP